MKVYTSFYIIFLFSCGCNQTTAPLRNTERSFYYWKTDYNPANFEKQTLASLNIKKLYLRFFDVDWNEEAKQELPKAQIRFTQIPDTSFSITPVVFITNECVRKLDSARIPQLAENIVSLIEKTCSAANIANVPELQIDCDWTAATRNRYFYLLEKIKQQPFAKNKQLSVTIRLYQLKYSSKTGIPPAGKGLLMCYNMGNLKNPATENSILETAELKKYIDALGHYPLTMDVALPLFDWKVLVRNNIWAGLIENLPDDSLQRHPFTRKDGNRFTFTADADVAGYTFLKGDVLRNENSGSNEIKEAAAIVNQYLKNTRPVVSLYHLDSVILKKYSLHELEDVFNCIK